MRLFGRKSKEPESVAPHQQTIQEEQLARSDAPGVTFHDDGRIEVNISSVAEARLALKQLQLKKREFTLLKRQVNEQERTIRASYTDQV